MSLYRECSLLKTEAKRVRTQVTCTKATSAITSRGMHNLRLPPNIRQASSAEIKHACKEHELIGKGTFANCYVTQVGPMKVCVKILSAGVNTNPCFMQRPRSFLRFVIIICHGCMRSVMSQTLLQ